MGRKLSITPGEILALRGEGMSSHDIAAKLDISVATVYRYIGKQHKRMERAEAFRDTAVSQEPAKPFSPKPVREEYRIGNSKIFVNVDHVAKELSIGTDAESFVSIQFGDIDELVRMIAWLSKQEEMWE